MFSAIRLARSIRARLYRFSARRSFRRFGTGSWLIAPSLVLGEENISIGDDVYIAPHSILAAQALTHSSSCVLEIGNGSRIGQLNHIYATQRLVIGKKVLTANGVYISDNAHRYEDVSTPVLDQPVRQLAEVRIGDGSWIGHNACIFGASIGRNSVVGANSVVTRDLPDYCVAVGAPARIVRRFDVEAGQWRRTSDDGAFVVE